MRRLLATLVLLSAPALAAQSAFLNPAFGDAGVAAPGVGTTSSVLDALLDANGGVLLAGEIDNRGGLIKLQADGSLDAAFGTGGSYTFVLDNRTSYLADVDLLDGGDILATGAASNTSQTDIGLGFVARLSPTGEPRSTFGDDGLVRIFEGTGYSRPALVDAEVLSDGRILVASSARDGELGQIIVLFLLQPDGSLDTTFGTDGVAIVDALVLIDDTVLLSDGRLILSGYLPTAPDGSESDAALVAVTPTGVLDTSFGVGGVERLSLGGDFDRYREIAIDSNGRIVASGTSSTTTNDVTTTEAVVARYSTAGALDATFGTNGVVRITGTNTRGGDISLLPDDRIVLVGTENVSSVLVAQLTEAGALDETFTSGGKAAFALSDGVFGLASAIYADGDILSAGYTYTNGNLSESSAFALRVTTGPVASEGTPGVASRLRLGVEGAHPARRVRVALSLAEAASVRVDLYDIRGRRAATLFDGALPVGDRTVEGPAGLAPGMYIVRALASDGSTAALPVVVR
ncbi:MAG: hypothetical protein AAGJ11_01095 [Bacteroidota bacterium]